MSEHHARRRRSPQSHPGSMEIGGSDTASDVSSWTKGPAFATPDNLQGAVIQLQSALKSFGFSGRVNFLNGGPEDMASTLNCIHNLLQRLQHEQLLKDDAQAEHRRLRSESQTYEQNLSRLKKEIEVKERDIATLHIKGRQEVDRHAEELTIMMRDRDTLQKHCNNLTRRQIQFQHEIRRKELQYEWLQEKLRNYLAERKRESSASMEIVGRLRQQSPHPPKERNKIASKLDDMLPGRNGNSKKNTSRGPKLDETMVKMIVTAYEEKQKELMAENNDLQEALNSIRKEYTDLMNAQMERGESSSKPAPSRVDSRITTTRVDSSGSGGPARNKLPTAASQESTSSQHSVSADGSSRDRPLNVTDQSGILFDVPQPVEDAGAEDIRRMSSLPDPILNVDHPDLVPWPISQEISLKGMILGCSDSAMLNTSEHAPVLPTVTEEEITESIKGTPRSKDPLKTEEEPLDAEALAEQTSLVLSTLSSTSAPPVTSSGGGSLEPPSKEDGPQNRTAPMKIPRTPFQDASSPASTSPARSRSQKFVWPPPSSTSPPNRDSPSPPRQRPALGKLPTPSNKPVPNIALLTEEQLKTELRTRAVDVEEAVRALKSACGSMQPQHMRSVMEKRLHMELTMAANLAEQQEAVVNLALAGLERARRAIPGSEAEMEDMASSVYASIGRSETLVSKIMDAAADPETEMNIQHVLEEVLTEFQELRERTNARMRAFRESPMMVSASMELSRNIVSLRERASGLTKEKEQIDRARTDLSDDKTDDPPPSRRTWAEKAEDEKHLHAADDLTPDIYSDDEGAPSATLSRILHAPEEAT